MQDVRRETAATQDLGPRGVLHGHAGTKRPKGAVSALQRSAMDATSTVAAPVESEGAKAEEADDDRCSVPLPKGDWEDDCGMFQKPCCGETLPAGCESDWDHKTNACDPHKKKCYYTPTPPSFNFCGGGRAGDDEFEW